MMGGSGDSRYSMPSSASLQQKLRDLRKRERERLEKDVTTYLQTVLAQFNDRDTDSIAERLGLLQGLLGKHVEIDQVLLGGSVAKHTAVDGLSDVDALVILDREDLRGKSAQAMLNAFYKTLTDGLSRKEVKAVEKGRLAVTVKYRDDTEIQLLPALKSGQTISIAGADGRSWNDTKPRAFQRELTQANKRLGQSLVPTIKLFKSIVSSLPQQKQLSGYHIEAMAVDASRTYTGPKTVRALLTHMLQHASERVRAPMKDSTGQSRTVDAYLGRANSVNRRSVSQALSGIRRRLEAASSVAEWRAVIGQE